MCLDLVVVVKAGFSLLQVAETWGRNYRPLYYKYLYSDWCIACHTLGFSQKTMSTLQSRVQVEAISNFDWLPASNSKKGTPGIFVSGPVTYIALLGHTNSSSIGKFCVKKHPNSLTPLGRHRSLPHIKPQTIMACRRVSLRSLQSGSKVLSQRRPWSPWLPYNVSSLQQKTFHPPRTRIFGQIRTYSHPPPTEIKEYDFHEVNGIRLFVSLRI